VKPRLARGFRITEAIAMTTAMTITGTAGAYGCALLSIQSPGKAPAARLIMVAVRRRVEDAVSDQILAALASFTIPTAIAPALGPVVGGILVTAASWQWVFYVNVPIGIAGFAFGTVFLPEHREAGTRRLDLPGFALSATGLGALMYALSEGPSQGWSSPLILTTGLAGIVLLAALVRVEIRAREPMIRLRLLTNRLFASTTAVMFTGIMAFLGSLYLIALFLQDGLGLSALNAGLSTLPEAVGVLLGAQAAARIYPHVGRAGC
jgi:MFS family permease